MTRRRRSWCNNASVNGGAVPWLAVGALLPTVRRELTGCNPGYTEWGFGSRTQWNVTKDFYMGVDVYYVKLQPEMSGVEFSTTLRQVDGEARRASLLRG